jgi:hypothetical protein
VRRLTELFKNYLSVIGLIGMSFFQVLNLEPSDHSFLAFVLFTVLAVLVVVYCAGIIFGTKLVRRPHQMIRKPAYSWLARGAAAAALVVTPPSYVVLVTLFHIPNTWPILVQAGADERNANPWIRTLHERPLDLGLKEAGRLFLPEKGIFFTSRAIHYITIDNRSTVSAPPLKLHLTLQVPSERSSPPAIFAAAVATPAVHRWRPFGSLVGNLIFGGLPKGPTWKTYDGYCKDTAVRRDIPVPDGWCFFSPPADRHTWYEPEIRLPSIPPRDSLEVYFELAFSESGPPGAIPATLDLRSDEGDKFPVNVVRNIDLQAGLHGGD